MSLSNDTLLAAAAALEFQAEYEWRDAAKQSALRAQAAEVRNAALEATAEMPLTLVLAGLAQVRGERTELTGAIAEGSMFRVQAE